MIKTPIVVVSGGLGNIGSFVVEQSFTELQAEKVIIIDNFYNSSLKRLDEIKDSLFTTTGRSFNSRIVLEEIDIVDYSSLLRVFRKWKPDYVFHLASTLTLDSKKFRKDAVLTNVVGTQNVIEACLETEVKHSVYASSASIFGDPDELPTSENHHFRNNSLLYGSTKIANEVMLTSYAEEFENFRFSAPRFWNVFGERASINAVYTQIVQKWITSILEGESITIYGDGTQTMDLLHGRDSSLAMILCVKKRAWRGNVIKGKKLEGFFNIGSGKSTTVLELKDILFRLMNKEVPVVFEEHDPNLVKRRQCDNRLAKKILEWNTTISLEDGLRRCIDVHST